jgi:ABC-type Co2+ transport system permease subunit
MRPNIAAHASTAHRKPKEETKMTWKSKLVLGILTAIAMLLLSFALPRGGGSFLRDTQAAQFPVTVGVWAIFVLLFVKLK